MSLAERECERGPSESVQADLPTSSSLFPHDGYDSFVETNFDELIPLDFPEDDIPPWPGDSFDMDQP